MIESAIGGKTISTTVEGRERYPISVRYARDFRDDLDSLKRVLVATPTGAQVPISMLADISYKTGPPSIRNENGQLVGFVFVDITTSDLAGYVRRASEKLNETVTVSARLLQRVGRTVPISPGRDEEAQGRDPVHPPDHFCPPLHQHQVGRENVHRPARGALLARRRVLAHLFVRLQHERGGLGRASSRSPDSMPRPAWSCFCISIRPGKNSARKAG